MRKKAYQLLAVFCAAAVVITANPAGMTMSVVAQEESGSGEENVVKDPVEDGDYTLTFQTQKEGTQEESMLAAYFDANVRLTVQNGKMTITLLNTKLADFLLDFTLGNEEGFAAAKKTGVGEAGSSGTYSMYEYSMEITSLTKITKAAALVSAMDGQVSDIGDYTKYLKADIQFVTITKGWNGYQTKLEEELPDGDQALNDALIDYGLDKNEDGTVTADEVAQYGGSKLDLSGYKLTKVDLLSYLPDTVTELNLSENYISKLPAGMLDNLSNLENFYIENNRVKEIPEGFFKNNKKLDWISFSGNELTSLKAGNFNGLESLTILDLEYNGINSMDPEALTGLKKLQQLSFVGNNLTTLPDGLLEPVSGCLKMLYLEENQFTSLPKAVEECTSLAELYVYDNQLVDIATVDFSKLPNLQELNLMNNAIKEIPDNAFATNTKLDGLDLYNNQISSLSPEILPKSANLRKLDVRLNNIRVVDRKLIAKSQSFNKFYPQKSAMGLTLKGDGNGTLSWTESLGILDLMFWYEETNDAKVAEIASEDEYYAFLKENGYDQKDLVDVLNDFKYDWDIVIKLQKQQEDGSFETISTQTISDLEDPMDGSFEAADDGIYRVVKELYSSTSGMNTYRFTVMSNEFDTKAGDQKPQETAAPDKTPETTPGGTTGNVTGNGTAQSPQPQPSATSAPVQPAPVQTTAPKKPDQVKNLKLISTKGNKPVLQWKKQAKASGYEIYCSRKKATGYKQIKVVKKAGSSRVTVRKQKIGIRYYFKVRAYRIDAGKKTYGAFSKSIAVSIKKQKGGHK